MKRLDEAMCANIHQSKLQNSPIDVITSTDYYYVKKSNSNECVSVQGEALDAPLHLLYQDPSIEIYNVPYFWNIKERGSLIEDFKNSVPNKNISITNEWTQERLPSHEDAKMNKFLSQLGTIFDSFSTKPDSDSDSGSGSACLNTMPNERFQNKSLHMHYFNRGGNEIHVPPCDGKCLLNNNIDANYKHKDTQINMEDKTLVVISYLQLPGKANSPNSGSWSILTPKNETINYYAKEGDLILFRFPKNGGYEPSSLKQIIPCQVKKNSKRSLIFSSIWF